MRIVKIKTLHPQYPYHKVNDWTQTYGTSTRVVIDVVLACSLILAWTTGTVIHDIFTLCATVSSHAAVSKMKIKVFMTMINPL